MEPNVIPGQVESLNNTKITSVNKFHKERLQNKRVKVPTGRPLTQMEALTVINAENLIQTTIHFIHMPTCPRELRSAADAPYLRSSCRPQDLQAVLAVTGQTARKRKNFPSNRLFTNQQITVIQDELRAPLQTDKITIFSMRPPELLFVDNCIDYLQWFERTSVCPLFNPKDALLYLKDALHNNEEESTWLDGFNNKITVRQAAVRTLFEYAKTRIGNDTASDNQRTYLRFASRATVELLSKLVWMLDNFPSHTQHVYTRTTFDAMVILKNRFVSLKVTRKLPIVWWTPIHPRRRTAFLIHIMLCKGRFTTEYDIMYSDNIRQSFIQTGLLNVLHPQESLHNLLRYYILHQLRIQPGGSFQFDRNLTDAYHLIKYTFFPTTTLPPTISTPAVLYSSMIRENNKKTEQYIKQCRTVYISAVYSELRHCNLFQLLPDIDLVVNARLNPISSHITDTFFPPPKDTTQSLASHQEQCEIMKDIKKSIALYRSGWQIHQNFVIVGGPGVGKTTTSTFSSLYCLCLGLNGIATSLVADRSKQLGGIHFHRLICMPLETNSHSPGRCAELALQKLYTYPEMIEFIRRLDFVNLDELGIFSAENLGILDMVFRYIRSTSSFMGGVFVFCTMDHLQLLPFNGTPVLLSLYVITDFTFRRLVELVRAANDSKLCSIIQLTRTTHWTKHHKEELAVLLRQNISYVDTFDDPRIPNDAIFVFSRKAPCRAAEHIIIERLKVIHAGRYHIANSIDEESTTGGNWHAATTGISIALDKRVKQRKQLLLYPMGKFEFTQVLKGKFNQGQLALLIIVPTEFVLNSGMAIEVFAAPSGMKNFPPPEESAVDVLIQNGWTRVMVPVTVSGNEIITTGVLARRAQYPLKPRVATTIHACMGSTLSSIVCAVVSLPDMPYDFSLWEAAQVIVLLSRTRYASQIYFVGDREDTIRHLIEVLSGPQHRYLHFISSLLDKLCGESNRLTEILPQPTEFCPRDSIIPRTHAVYLIVSTKQPSFAYIGETNNLARRLQEHNSLNGPEITAQLDLIPFAIHAYVIGFCNRSERLQFESEWKLNNRRRTNISLNNNGHITIALDMITQLNTERQEHGIQPLRLIECGQIIRNSLQIIEPNNVTTC